MKPIATKVLERFSYRQVLLVNTVMIGFTIYVFVFVGQFVQPNCPDRAVGAGADLFNSLQFSSIN